MSTLRWEHCSTDLCTKQWAHTDHHFFGEFCALHGQFLTQCYTTSTDAESSSSEGTSS